MLRLLREFLFSKTSECSTETVAHISYMELEISLGHETSKLTAQIYSTKKLTKGSKHIILLCLLYNC